MCVYVCVCVCECVCSCGLVCVCVACADVCVCVCAFVFVLFSEKDAHMLTLVWNVRTKKTFFIPLKGLCPFSPENIAEKSILRRVSDIDK